MMSLLLAVLTTSVGMVLYKLYVVHGTRALLLLTVLTFLLAPIFSFLALKVYTLDVVYMATSVNGLLVLWLSKMFLAESIFFRQYLGALLIALGVAIYMARFL